jgi:hypothetical protein
VLPIPVNSKQHQKILPTFNTSPAYPGNNCKNPAKAIIKKLATICWYPLRRKQVISNTIAKILAALFSSVIQAIRHPITRMLHMIPHNNVCHQGKLTLSTAIAITLAVKSLATIP